MRWNYYLDIILCHNPKLSLLEMLIIAANKAGWSNNFATCPDYILSKGLEKWADELIGIHFEPQELDLNDETKLYVHKNALAEYMKYAVCKCQDCELKWCDTKKCRLAYAEQILSRDIAKAERL